MKAILFFVLILGLTACASHKPSSCYHNLGWVELSATPDPGMKPFKWKCKRCGLEINAFAKDRP